MELLHTALPFKPEEFERIGTMGAIVDMGAIGFKSPDPLRTALIYLRNVGFDKLKLDFSGMPYEDRAKLMKMFVECDIECSQPEFVQTWGAVFAISAESGHMESFDGPLLSVEEQRRFYDENRDMVETLKDVVNAFPLMLLSRIKTNEPFKDDLEHDGNTVFGPNISNFANDFIFCILSNGGLNSIARICGGQLKLKWYDRIFTENNERLFSALRSTMLGFIIDVAVKCVANGGDVDKLFGGGSGQMSANGQ